MLQDSLFNPPHLYVFLSAVPGDVMLLKVCTDSISLSSVSHCTVVALLCYFRLLKTHFFCIGTGEDYQGYFKSEGINLLCASLDISSRDRLVPWMSSRLCLSPSIIIPHP